MASISRKDVFAFKNDRGCGEKDPHGYMRRL